MEIENSILEHKILLEASEQDAITKFIGNNGPFSKLAFRKFYFEVFDPFRKKYYTNNYLDLLNASDKEINYITDLSRTYKTPQLIDEIVLVQEIYELQKKVLNLLMIN